MNSKFVLVLVASITLGCGTDGGSDDGSGGGGAAGGTATGGTTAAGGTGASAGAGGASGASAGGAGGAATRDLTFAVIGDFGDALLDSLSIGGLSQVAGLVNSWELDFVITTGDNNYPNGAASTIDANVGQFFQQYIGNYQGTYGPGADTNRFWPTPGNHDWRATDLQPYIDYFDLPGNERYYDVDLGLVHLFAIDSEGEEPDGSSADSVQGMWLQDQLAASTACFKIVYFHRPAYSSARHGSSQGMQWPFEQWGADAVLAGHDHVYERLRVGGIPYFVNGFGGSLKYELSAELPESEFFFNAEFGAQRVIATPTGITFEAHAVDSGIIDTHRIDKTCDQ